MVSNSIRWAMVVGVFLEGPTANGVAACAVLKALPSLSWQLLRADVRGERGQYIEVLAITRGQSSSPKPLDQK